MPLRCSGELTVHWAGMRLPATTFSAKARQPRLTTGAAVGFRQAVFHLLDARVLEDEKLAVSERQHAGQADTQRGHETSGNRKT